MNYYAKQHNAKKPSSNDNPDYNNYIRALPEMTGDQFNLRSCIKARNKTAKAKIM